MSNGKRYKQSKQSKSPFNRYDPYQKRLFSSGHKDTMEDTEKFLTTDLGKSWMERRQLSSKPMDTISIDDYSPPASPVRVELPDGTHRCATIDDMEDWKHICPDDYEKRQFRLRFTFARDLMSVGIPHQVSWAKAFRKYPKEDDGKQERGYKPRSRFVFVKKFLEKEQDEESD